MKQFFKATIFIITAAAGILGNKAIAQGKNKEYFHTIGRTFNKPKIILEEDSTNNDEEFVEEDSITTISADTIKQYMPTVSLPLNDIHINSAFGIRKDPLNRRSKRQHNGLDLRARFENVYSMLPGTVIDSGSSVNGGNFVTIQHGICVCIYLHLSKILVSKGQRVFAGQKVAVSGNSGKRTTGPHLHISCRFADVKGKYFDPMIIINYVIDTMTKNLAKRGKENPV